MPLKFLELSNGSTQLKGILYGKRETKHSQNKGHPSMRSIEIKRNDVQAGRGRDQLRNLDKDIQIAAKFANMVQIHSSQMFGSTVKLQKATTFKSPRLGTNNIPEKELNVSADKTLTRERTNSDECNVEAKDEDDHIKAIPSSMPALRMNIVPLQSREPGKMHIILYYHTDILLK